MTPTTHECPTWASNKNNIGHWINEGDSIWFLGKSRIHGWIVILRFNPKNQMPAATRLECICKKPTRIQPDDQFWVWPCWREYVHLNYIKHITVVVVRNASQLISNPRQQPRDGPISRHYTQPTASHSIEGNGRCFVLSTNPNTTCQCYVLLIIHLINN